METIKSYLEAMFAGMPNTPEVRKAKSELLQMMEDKYNELISENQSENSAVGTVISEFGNLDELAEDLGLKRELEEAHTKEAESPRRHIILEEAQAFITSRGKKALFLSLGVMLCIMSVAPVIVLQNPGGVALMFLSIALGVGSIVYSSFIGKEWNFMRTELCQIDMNTASYLKERRRSFEPVHAACITIGVILCIVCWVPILFFTNMFEFFGAALLFVIVGIGVFLIVYSNSISNGFDLILRVNDASTISGNYRDLKDLPQTVKYKSKTAETIVVVYWPTITCLYLIISFLTFQWGITWIIWPIAAVARRAVVINCISDEE